MPQGVVFPLSAVILERIADYRTVLESYSKPMHIFISNYIDMPNRVIDLLIRFLRQNNGKFSKRALGKEFSDLTAEEIITLEAKYAEIFSQDK